MGFHVEEAVALEVHHVAPMPISQENLQRLASHNFVENQPKLRCDRPTVPRSPALQALESHRHCPRQRVQILDHQLENLGNTFASGKAMGWCNFRRCTSITTRFVIRING
ncbi:unnamed protein product [Cladocopium goreaui]|uniref:Uncharacterized protein n=1 Tax=Cladocopium goreaui TaxID=2562237 RepID=A0A9P1G724_9DINO|nr:unnamed protein product [Cladocopium goreaui]